MVGQGEEAWHCPLGLAPEVLRTDCGGTSVLLVYCKEEVSSPRQLMAFIVQRVSGSPSWKVAAGRQAWC